MSAMSINNKENWEGWLAFLLMDFVDMENEDIFDSIMLNFIINKPIWLSSEGIEGDY